MSALTVLITPADINSRVDAVVSFACDPKHYWRDHHPPHDPHYQVQVGGWRCVFTITRYANGLLRELSVSDRGRQASDDVMRLLGAMFGFEGVMGSDWSLAHEPHATMALQQYDPTHRHPEAA
jgi:hypothetical protein